MSILINKLGNTLNDWKNSTDFLYLRSTQIVLS